MRDLYPGNRVPQIKFDPVVQNVIPWYPAPNRTPSNANTFSQNYQDAQARNVNWSQWNAKFDHRFGEKNSLFFRYTQARHQPSGNDVFTDPNVGRNRNDDQTNRNAVLSDTHTFSPTLINSFRVGLSRQLFTFETVGAYEGYAQKIGLPDSVPSEQVPDVNVSPYPRIGGGALGKRSSLNWDVQNMVTKISGNHVFKFGLNVRDLYGGNRQGGALSGFFRFNGLTQNPQSRAGTGADLAQFLTGDVTSAGIDRILGNSWHGFNWSAFVQDDWRVSTPPHAQPWIALGLPAEALRALQRADQLRSRLHRADDRTAWLHGIRGARRPASDIHRRGLQRLWPAHRFRVRPDRRGQDRAARRIRDILRLDFLPELHG